MEAVNNQLNNRSQPPLPTGHLRKICSASIGLLFFPILLLLANCSDETNPEDDQNPYEPNSNHRIVAQQTFGSHNERNNVFSLHYDGTGGFYYHGQFGSEYGLGRLSSAGELVWFVETPYRVRGLLPLPANSPVPGGVISAGTEYPDDNEFFRGRISLFGSTDTLLSHITYSVDSVNTWVNTIASLSDSSFVVTGGREDESTMGVFVATVTLSSSGLLAKNHEIVITDIPDAFHNMVVDDSETTDSRLVFYALSGARARPRTLMAHRLTLALPDLATYTTDWSRNIVVFPGMGINGASYGDAIALVNGVLVILGDTNDPQKLPLPNNGGYWNSGVVASLTTGGEIRWSKKVAVTGYSDDFKALVIAPDAIYAVGEAAAFVRSGRSYGYAWIAKISYDTGDLLASLTIGDQGYGSWFGGALAAGDAVYCGGGKNADYVDGGYRGWFCEIDIVDTPPMIPAVQPVPAGSPAPNTMGAPKHYLDVGRLPKKNEL
jgi:hypothetical protein